MRREAPNNRIAKMTLAVALVSCLFGQTLPAMAQYSLQAEQDSLLPPDVVPLDPAVGQKMSQAQAAARQNMNNSSYGQQSAMAGDPSGMNTGMSNGMSNGNGGGMQNFTQGNMQPNMQAMGQPNMQGQPSMQGQAPGTTGTSDWIMPGGQNQNSSTTAYGNVSQTQTLTAPPSNPIVRRSTRRGGMGTAVSALAGFGAGALVGTMIRRPNSLFGLGTAGLMLTGFGTRGGYRF